MLRPFKVKFNMVLSFLVTTNAMIQTSLYRYAVSKIIKSTKVISCFSNFELFHHTACNYCFEQGVRIGLRRGGRVSVSFLFCSFREVLT